MELCSITLVLEECQIAAAENTEKGVRTNQRTADFKVRDDFPGPDAGRYWTESSPALVF
jgi:hypothetical protein